MEEIGLEEKVTGQQASKKWEKLKKYKVCDVKFKINNYQLPNEFINQMRLLCLL